MHGRRTATRSAIVAITTIQLFWSGSLLVQAAAQPALLVSSFPDRSSPSELTGQTLAGNAYVFVDAGWGTAAVWFYLDAGERRHAEYSSPFDFSGTGGDGNAIALDTRSLADGNHSITATIRSTNGTTQVVSSSFNVVNRSIGADSTTIWSRSTVPGTVAASDSSPLELGLRFYADVVGTVSGVRFYKSPSNTGTHTGSLWASSGKLLARATFTGETTSGWQQVSFSSPVTIAPATPYVVSYHTNAGHYSVDQHYFTGRGVDSGPLHVAAEERDANGVFRYGDSAFPTDRWKASNYWVDLVFTPIAATGATTNRTTSVTTTPTTQQGARACPAYPAVPDASCTGVPPGTHLTTYTGPDTITVPGTVIDGKIIHGGINIRANDVIIRRSHITGRVDTSYASTYTGILVEDSKIDGSGTSTSGSEAGVGNTGYTLRRVDISGFRTGVWLEGNATVEDSYIHNLLYLPGAHQSGAAIEGGSNNTLRHNTIVCDTDGCSNAAGLYNETYSPQPYTNISVQSNFFRGGAFMFYGGCPSVPNVPCPTYVRVEGNTFHRSPSEPLGGQYGPVVSWVDNTGNTWLNNTWSDDGRPVYK